MWCVALCGRTGRDRVVAYAVDVGTPRLSAKLGRTLCVGCLSLVRLVPVRTMVLVPPALEAASVRDAVYHSIRIHRNSGNLRI